MWLEAGRAHLSAGERWVAWAVVGLAIGVLIACAVVVALTTHRSKSERHADEIRDAENRGRAPYLALARALDDEMAGNSNEYANGVRYASSRIWKTGRGDPDADPVAALAAEDREWLDDMGWTPGDPAS